MSNREQILSTTKFFQPLFNIPSIFPTGDFIYGIYKRSTYTATKLNMSLALRWIAPGRGLQTAAIRGLPLAYHQRFSSFGYRRYSTETDEQSTEDEDKLSKATSPKKMKQQRPTIAKVGIPFEPFIPPRWSRLPNPITSPILYAKCFFKKIYMSCYNWVQVYQFKRNMGKGYKPNFLKWKNEAIEDYVKVNKAFSERKLEKARDLMAEYVYFALGRRQKQLPKNTSLGWELVRFNSQPKLVTFHTFPHDDGSILLSQIVYKFDTKQKMIIKKRNSPEFTEKVRDLVEYLAFNVDPYTDRVVIAGSVFESIPQRGLSQTAMPSQEETINCMVRNGDIYRPEPSYEEKLAEVKASKST
ncbi:DEKNAAC101873 [Brettanomyces naardenensis]|uniref:DEKNAAC101873 n=1 Tax=Brettanomyces naardenensis TaxID=13370 RepID=A0A448YJ73_BRENA|nr:DEKNAAC101873 [Brettanomyces naardenensis]